MTDANDPTPLPSPPSTPLSAAALLQYFDAAARRRHAGVTALAVGAVVVGVAGAIVSTITLVNLVVPDGSDQGFSLWDNRSWAVNEAIGLLSAIMMSLGGVAFLRRSPFLWHALVIHVLLSLIASVVWLIPAIWGQLSDGVDLNDAYATLSLSHVTVYGGYVVFETFLLLLLTRKPVRSFIECVARNDPGDRP